MCRVRQKGNRGYRGVRRCLRSGEEPDEVDELDKLRDALAKLPTYDALAVTRSTVLRLAIARGVNELREEIEAATPKKKRRR